MPPAPATSLSPASRQAERVWLRDRSVLVTLLLGAVLALLVLPPIWFLVEGSLHTTTPQGRMGVLTLAYYRDFLSNRRFLQSIVNSFVFAFGSSALAILCGGAVAWATERTNTPCKALAYLTAIISLGTPYLLYVTAWLFLLGRNGPVNDLLRALTGATAPVFNVYSMSGMIVIEGFLWSPMAFLLLAPIFRAANADYEEAARMCGAGLLRTIRRISMRLATPALLAVGLLSIIRSLEAFEVPALVGIPGRVSLLTTDIYVDIQQRVPPDLGQASAFAVFLLLLAALLIHFYSRISKNVARYQTVTGRGFRPRGIDLGRGRYLSALLLIVNFLLILGLPTAGLVWLSLMPFNQTVSLRALHSVTLANYVTVFHAASYFKLVWQTLFMAAASASLAMALTVLSGWLAARRRKGAWVLDQLATLPLVFPGIVLGVAMMQMFLASPVPIYGTLTAFVLAFTVRYMPYGIRYAYAGVIQIHTQLEEAAGVAGASLATVFRRIVVPLALPTIVSGWLFIFLISARDLSLSVLLASPSTQPVSVAMLDLWSNGQGPELAAFGLCWTAIMAVVATIFYAVGRRSAAGTYGGDA